MSVQVAFLGRLGNNLFQYAIGRIIAQQLGLQLACSHTSSGITERNYAACMGATLSGLRYYFPQAPLFIAGQHTESPVETFQIEEHNPWRGHKIDVAAVLANRNVRRIQLRGYFQRIQYFSEYRTCIRKWFRPKGVNGLPRIRDNDVLLNIRRGKDYYIRHWILPMSYYKCVLSRLQPFIRLFVCGTGLDQEVYDALAVYRPIYFRGSPIEHFEFIRRFCRIVLSNSTFAWWAAYLSDAQEIYGPHANSGKFYAFSGYSEVDLDMREPRYISVPTEA